MFRKDQLDLLKQFVTACKANPTILHSPEISFFKEWLLSLNATIPEPPKQTPPPEQASESKENHVDEDMDDVPDLEDVEDENPTKPAAAKEEESEEEAESDLELETLDGIVTDEIGEELETGDDSVEVTEEMMDESNAKRGEAQGLLCDGNLDGAIKAFTEAIKKNPQSANLYAKRASALIKAKRPKAALHDCEKALSINKDSAQPYKWRGRAYRLLGKYEEAYHDFQMACRLDFDETAFEWQKEVEPNAKKIMEHNRKYERQREEREIKRKIKEAKRRKEEAEREYEREKQREQARAAAGGFPGGFPGGMPGGMGGMPGGMGGMPGGMGGMPGAGGMPGGAGGAGGMPDLNALFSDPELMAAMQDPEVMAAFQDVSKNPANMSKYEGNPKVKRVIEKLQSKFGGGAGGMPGM